MPLFDSHDRYSDPVPIGSGGMGTVFRVYDNKLGRQVAVKVMNVVASTADEVKRFEQEARSMAVLQHPHVCAIHDFDREVGHPFLVMDLIDGESLRKHIKTSWPISTEKFAKWIWQVAQALTLAHSKKILHRDVKPENIMIDTLGNAVLMDFGLAKITGSSKSLTQHGGFMGTVAYASPEQIRETTTVDHRSDIYSLGIVLYELLCRRRPFEGDPLSIIRQMLDCEGIPTPSTYYNPIDGELEAICLKATALTTTDRFQSMQAFADSLKTYLETTVHFASTLTEASKKTPTQPTVDLQVFVPPRVASSNFWSQPSTVPTESLKPRSESGRRSFVTRLRWFWVMLAFVLIAAPFSWDIFRNRETVEDPLTAINTESSLKPTSGISENPATKLKDLREQYRVESKLYLSAIRAAYEADVGPQLGDVISARQGLLDAELNSANTAPLVSIAHGDYLEGLMGDARTVEALFELERLGGEPFRLAQVRVAIAEAEFNQAQRWYASESKVSEYREQRRNELLEKWAQTARDAVKSLEEASLDGNSAQPKVWEALSIYSQLERAESNAKMLQHADSAPKLRAEQIETVREFKRNLVKYEEQILANQKVQGFQIDQLRAAQLMAEINLTEADDQQPLDEKAKRLTELRHSLRKLQRERLKTVESAYKAGTAELYDVLSAYSEMWGEELALASTDDERIGIHRVYVENVRQLESQIQSLYDAERKGGEAYRLSTVRCARLRGEIQLLRAQMQSK